MQEPKIYLDYSSSHPLLPSVITAMTEALYLPGNMQSAHSRGMTMGNTKTELESLLAEKYKYLYPEITGDNIIITSSGSDSNSIALSMQNECTVAYPFFAHPSTYTRTCADCAELPYYCFDDNMNLKKGYVEDVVKNYGKDTTIYATPSVSSISGDIINAPHFKGSEVFIDDVQGFMKSKINNVVENDIMGVSVSAHKIGGPCGIGAIIYKNIEDADYCRKYVIGGSMSYPLVVGFLEAIRAWNTHYDPKHNELLFLKMYAAAFEANEWNILNSSETSASNSTCLLKVKRPIKDSINGINYAVDHLDNKGLLVSETSACSSNVPVDVYKMYEMNPREHDLVRVSWGCFTEENHIDELITALNSIN